MQNHEKTIYILIGPQGSGKTHWANNVLLAHDRTGIVRISQDEQGKGGHWDLFNQCLNEGVSMVIDRMNFNHRQRNKYVEPAMDRGYDVIFVLFDGSRSMCLERLAKRKDHPTISVDDNHDTVLNTYFHHFEHPYDSFLNFGSDSYDIYDEMVTIVGKKGKSKMLDLRPRCYNRRVIVVGDIHGCFDTFMSLLDKCEYRADDIIIATGDLVDRGPKIKETLLWFRNTPGVYSVEGNHDNKFRRYLMGNPVKITNGLDCTIQQCNNFGDPSEWEAWIKSLPMMIRLRDFNEKPFYVVHAGVDGRYPIENQQSNVCLYARYLDGSNFFDEDNGIPWWKTLDGSYTIASGHIISENVHPCESVYCLDGGAYQGGKLRALVIEKDQQCHICEVNGYSSTQ